MRFKDYIFKHLKNQKQNLQDAVIDIPRQTYAVGVFSNPEDKDPKIKPEIIGMIMKQFTEFKKEYPIFDYTCCRNAGMTLYCSSVFSNLHRKLSWAVVRRNTSKSSSLC